MTNRPDKFYKLALAAALAMTAQYPAPAFALDCNSAQNTMELNECASIAKDKTEKKLNETYRRVLQSLGKRDEEAAHNAKVKTSLVAAQREWVKFREADCQAVYTKHEEGTIRTVMYLGCLDNHAQRRIKDLEDYDMRY